ncbi:elongation factor P maturation arginine rhamnosyltransferase EarP [Hydrogenophaga sp.]|uniref:elongation factor P maturation arginine rhamnosyltransferase EarP n=1 Tax=Hydrogenophaga sp. TaxID=1904254 RepID=UPI003F72B159
MSRHSPPRNTTWDLFTPTEGIDGLRDLPLLAAQLATVPTQRVRIFLDDPGRLGVMSARIESTLWVQPLANYEIWRLRLADAIAPADNVVCLGGTEVPTRYRERMAYGASNRCKQFRIWPLGHSLSSGEATTANASMNTMVFDVIQDEKVQGVGLIKDVRNNVELRTRWKAHASLTQTTLESLGLPGDKAKGALIVSCWDAAIADFPLFVQSLAQAFHQPVLVLRNLPPAGASHTPVPTSPATAHVHVLDLPALSWSQQDEVIWSSDLLFCGQRDVANRAMEAGTPLLWLPRPTASGAAQATDRLSDWYFDGLDPGFKRGLLVTAHCLREGESLEQTLAWYLKQRDDLEQIARQVARRIAQARPLADTLPSLSPTMLEQVRRQQQQRENAHPPTWPMSLPGPVESA